ncbi:MAG: PCRF domain-containing protein, partial [Mailhella sp.]|nr:PCRF domain-containing protein [Mailhella sp.]
MIQLAELRARCNALAEQFNSLWGRLDLPSKEARLDEIEKIISSPDAWNDQEKMTPVLKEKSRVEAEVARYRELQTAYEETQEWLGFVSEGEDDALETLNEQADLLEKFLTQTEMTVLLSGEADHMDALMDIHPGAGGTEAQDWAEMLERMYLRWAESQGYKAEIVDLLPGDEAGIKSVTIRIQGDNAYGLLRGEKGVHRLIRISPFDASGRRQTSFVSVDLIPDAGEIQGIEIKEADLRIDVYRASGAGGQHVNKTESAVRITHIPT